MPFSGKLIAALRRLGSVAPISAGGGWGAWAVLAFGGAACVLAISQLGIPEIAGDVEAGQGNPHAPPSQASASAAIGRLQSATLRALDLESSANFGASVAISGDVVVVGAPNHDLPQSEGDPIADAGAVYVFVEPTGGWTSDAAYVKLTASDGSTGDLFGYSVAIDGDTIVVGARFADTPNSNAGAAYVFTKPAGGWESTSTAAKLTASGGSGNAEFGASVSVSGDTIVVGAHGQYGDDRAEGAAYVFVEPAGGWAATANPTATLTAPMPEEADHFGQSVSIDGDTIAVGAPEDDHHKGADAGSVYIFTKPAGGWGSTSTAAHLTGERGTANHLLGYSVDMDGDTVIAGAPINGFSPGSASLFTKPAGGWSTLPVPRSKLQPSQWKRDDGFGETVAVYDGQALAASKGRDTADGRDAGAAYIFAEPNDGWADASETQTLTSPNGMAREMFGSSVAIDAGGIVIGAPRNIHNGVRRGAAYIFVPESVDTPTPTNTPSPTPMPTATHTPTDRKSVE